MAQIPAQILNYLPPAVRDLLEGGSKRELLKKINATLLVFDDEVLHIESGNSATISRDGDSLDPQQLAAASKSLLGDSQQKEHSVLLLLPSDEFIATTQNMPGVSKDNLLSALKLQSATILPAYDQSLALAVNPASADVGENHTVLWMSNSRVMQFFDAFANNGMFIAAVKPRILNLKKVDSESPTYITDYDNRHITSVKIEAGIIKNWFHVNAADLQQQEFDDQWQQATGNRTSPSALELKSTADYLDQSDNSSNLDYSFFPQGALTARKKIEKGRNFLLAAAVVAVLLFFSAIPFIAQSFEFRRLARTLELNREMSFDARQDQSAVVSFENEWGPINDFPDQKVREALYTLVSVLSPERLTSLELVDGLIKLQGTSSDPQAILQRLEQDPMFTEVVFSRATNNTRYYIDLRLSTVNFEAYMVRYFPDE